MSQPHTSGPWEVFNTGEQITLVSGAVRVAVIDTASMNAGLDNEEGEANARLIAAAPVLLEVLLSVLQALEAGGLKKPKDWERSIRAIVISATGGK